MPKWSAAFLVVGVILLLSMVILSGNARRPVIKLDEEEDDYFYRRYLSSENVCADGTPFTYFVRRPTSTSRNYNKWIVYLEGGHHCATEEECYKETQDLEAYYTTAIDDEALIVQTELAGGILGTHATTNSRFYDYSMVFIHSCNEDSLLGRAPAFSATNPTRWHFTGAINMWATLDDLVNHDFKSSKPDYLLVVGIDHGGVALVNQLARLEDYFGRNQLGDVPRHYVADACYFSGLEEYYCYGHDCYQEFKEDVYTHNPELDAACVNAGYFVECMYLAEAGLEFISPEIKNNKLFIIHNHYDNKVLNNAKMLGTKRSDITAEDWENRRAEYLLTQLTTPPTGVSNLWASNCNRHGIMNKAAWDEIIVEGLTPMEAVQEFISGSLVAVIDPLEFEGNPSCLAGLDVNWRGNSVGRPNDNGGLNVTDDEVESHTFGKPTNPQPHHD